MGMVTAYLVLLAGASFFFRARKHVANSKTHRFAVLVPAHNEARSIGRLLQSLRAMDYDSDAYEVHVVADNCTDATARIVLDAGANVHERFDLTQRGKGHALRWLM